MINAKSQGNQIEHRFNFFVQNVIDSIGDAIFIHDLKGHFIEVNLLACGRLGYTKDELLQMTLMELDSPEYAIMMPVRIKEICDKGHAVFETVHLRKDGLPIPTEICSRMIEYAGKPAVLNIARDISDRKLAEAALQKERDMAQKYLDVAGVMIVVIDRDQRVTIINKKGAEILGYGVDEIIGKNWFDNFILPGIKDSEKDDYVKLMNGDIEPVEHFENIVIAKDNIEKTIVWHNTILRDENGIISGVLSSGEDITQQKIYQKRVQNEKDLSTCLIQFSAFSLFVIDPEHKVLYWNKACEELTGVKAEDIIGTSNHGKIFYGFERPCVADIIISKNMDDFKKYYLKHSSSKLISNGLHAESWFQNLGGEERYVIFDAAPIENNEGKLIGVVESLQDITDIKLTEEKLKNYADELEYSNELKDLFTDILRHDLLNPASIIKGHTEFLLKVEKDGKKAKSLQKIEKSNEKLIDIIETAAKFAKFESVEELEFEAKDIAVVIKDVANNFRPQIENKQMEFEFKAKGSYPVNVNPVIEEVFANLLSNAIKYSPQKNKIIVDIIDVGENWKVEVTDFGVGISDKDKTALFERFKRVGKGSVKGTGLGLAIVKRIIELHGGSVGVDDNPAGQGSVFWFTVGKA